MTGPDERELVVRAFDLGLTLESGQFFRYERRGEAYRLVVRDRVFELRQEGDHLRYRGVDEAFLVRFLGLDRDSDLARRRLRRHAWLRPALDHARGLRIVRQDLWECLVGFLCSAVSNIPRIRRNVEDLAALYGRRVGSGDLVARALPRPGKIRNDGSLRSVRLGFRGQRLLELQQRVDEDWLQSLEALPAADQRRWLMTLPGVGEKVADCVLLFALGRDEAFPVDVWIRRVIEARALRRKAGFDKIREWASSTLGGDAGYAQQALFVWARHTGRGALSHDEPPSRGASRPNRTRGASGAR